MRLKRHSIVIASRRRRRCNLFHRLAMITLFFVFSFNAFAQTTADQLSQKLQNLNTFQANFSQAINDKKGNTLQSSKGKMALKRPGLFRWETISPNQQLIVADSKNIWIYDQDLAQITKQNQNAASNTPGLLLSDSVNRLITKFKITAQDENTFILTPKGKKDLFQSVELIFDGDNLKQMLLHDNLGQTTQITFSNAKVNPTVPNSFFIFIPPKNVDIVSS